MKSKMFTVESMPSKGKAKYNCIYFVTSKITVIKIILETKRYLSLVCTFLV